MRVTIQQEPDRTVVHLVGELDALSCAAVVDEVRGAADAGPSAVVLNLRALRFVDSTGLRAIVRISRELARQGRKLAVSRPSAFCRSLMETVGLDRIVQILEPDADPAVRLPESRVAAAGGGPRS